MGIARRHTTTKKRCPEAKEPSKMDGSWQIEMVVFFAC